MTSIPNNWRLEEAQRVYPDIRFESVESRNWTPNNPPIVRYSSRYDPTTTPMRVRVLLPAGMLYVSYIGKNKEREKQFGSIDWNFDLPGWPGQRRPRLRVRDGKITSLPGQDDALTIALVDEWIDPILTRYDLRRVRDFLTELNLRSILAGRTDPS